MRLFRFVLSAIFTFITLSAYSYAQTSGNTPPPPPVCSQSIAGQLYTNTGTSPATVYTCSYYNLSWQWVVNPSYGGLVYYPVVPSTCTGALPAFLAGWPSTQMYICVSGFPQLVNSGGSWPGYPIAGLVASSGTAWRAPVYGDITKLWTTCTTGFMKGDGTCPSTAYTLPATVMQTNQANTYGAYALDLSSSTLLTLPASFTVAIANGGTGATTAAGANLNITGVTQTGTLGTSSQVSTFPGTVAAGSATPTTIGPNGVLLNGVPALQAQTSLNNYYSGGAGNLTGTGTSNTANGQAALNANTTGIGNTANGYAALNANTTGSGNTANGVQALTSNTTGFYNTANGFQALFYNTTGPGNTANGVDAGQYTADGVTANQTSSNSVYEGFQAYPLASGDTNENVIGNTAIGHGSNTTTLGNTSITDTYLAGTVHGTSFTGNAATATTAASLTGALSANQLLGSLTAVAPTGQSVPSCSTAASALLWTSGSGFSCNTSITANTASTATTATNLSGGTVAATTITGTSSATLGTNGGTGGSLVLNGATSGSATISVSTTGVLALPSGTTATSMSLTTPSLGAATATSINKVAITAPTTSATITVADGTTLTETYSMNVAKTAGVAGAIPWYDTTTSESATALLAQNGVLIGGGASAAPSTIAVSTTTTQALFATATAPAFRVIAYTDLPTGTAANQVVLGGAIAAGGPTGGATSIPVITYNAAGQLTTVTTATPTVGTVQGGAAGEILYQSAANTTGFTGAGTAGQTTFSGGTGAPTFGDLWMPEKIVPASCNNATAGNGMSLPTANAATPFCRTGTYIQTGYLQFTGGTTSQSAQFQTEVPADVDTAAVPYVRLNYTQGTDTTNGHVIAMQVQSVCGGTTDDIAWPTATAFPTTTPSSGGAANDQYTVTVQLSAANFPAACAAGVIMNFNISTVTTTNTNTTVNLQMVTITWPEKTPGVAGAQ